MNLSTDMSLVELRAEAEKRGLAIYGSKQDIIEKIQKFDAAAAEAEPEKTEDLPVPSMIIGTQDAAKDKVFSIASAHAEINSIVDKMNGMLAGNGRASFNHHTQCYELRGGVRGPWDFNVTTTERQLLHYTRTYGSRAMGATGTTTL